MSQSRLSVEYASKRASDGLGESTVKQLFFEGERK